jgi:AraC-like DNA-binding protein
VLASRGDTRWARLAVALGFSDQSHLIRELTQIRGFSPSYLRRQLAQIDHGPVEP